MNVNTTGGPVMNQELDLLLKLQVIDYDIGELERSKEYLPDMMDNLKKEISDSKNHLEQTNTDTENAKVLQRQLELDISELENNLQKFQKQMMSIKTNKEYDALVAEIDNIKQKLSGKETELLETIDSIAIFERELEPSKEKLSLVDENNLKQLEVLKEKVDTIGNRMAEKINDRNEISASIPRRTLSVYERVRKGKGGAVVVSVKKRACGACYKALTPRKIQEVKKADKVLTCDHCGRILFWIDEDSN